MLRAAQRTINKSSSSYRSFVTTVSTCQATPPPPPAAEEIVEKNNTDLAAPNLSDDDSRFVGMTGAEILYDFLKAHDVKQVFGYPGGAILPVFDALYNTNEFNFVLPRHEQGGGHMAEGYARVTGKPGVLIVTSGPGATNLVTPLQDALMDGTPLVVFTGQVPTAAIGTDAFQEADVVGITRSCTKWNCLVKDLKDLPQRINEAFHIAQSGRPGPVLVDLPKDVTAGILTEIPNSQPRVATRMEKFVKKGGVMGMDSDQLTRVVNLINGAERPVIYAGQGVLQSEASALLKDIAEKANIPVTTTIQGLGCFDELNKLSLHMLGMHGSAYANNAMQKSDLIIALGARFDDRVTGNLKEFAPAALEAESKGKGGIVHFEIAPKNINKVVNVTESVVGDLKIGLKQLLNENSGIKYNKREEWFEKINAWKKRYPFTYEKPLPGGALKPQQILEEVNRQTQHLGDKVVFTTGVGGHQMWAAQYIRWRHPRSWVSSGGSGTMGFGLPSAIGAQLGRPDAMVIDVDGDASFAMTCQEFMTAAQYQIPVKVLILNNHYMGMVRQWQDLFYDKRYSGTEMWNPCYAQLADSMGGTGFKLSEEKDLEKVVAEWIACDGPCVLDAMCEGDEHVYPMVPAGKALHEMVLPVSQR